MTWQYLKTGYENVYAWLEKCPDETCFYCHKQRDADEMAIAFFSEVAKGICKLCMMDFRIGNLATDRHVVERIIADKGYKRRVDVLNWFKRGGYELFEADSSDDPEYDWKAYSFVNNSDAYYAFLARTKEHGQLPNGRYLTDEESKEMGELLDDYTRIEIFKDGGIHIIY